MKTCSKCRATKPFAEFKWKSVTRGVRHAQCADCTRAAIRRDDFPAAADSIAEVCATLTAIHTGTQRMSALCQANG